MHILVFGAHPDDPDSGAGGLIALLTEAGHRVTAVSFTKGELTGRMSSIEENAKVNVEEAIKAFKLLGASVIFLDFKDGGVWVTEETVIKVKSLLERLKPDIVLTHWPVDSHSDHRAVGIATIGAVRRIRTDPKPMLYFYEVMTGMQTHCFIPEIYVNVTEKAELKRKACYLHENCFPERWYPVHEKMMEFRGLEMGARYAEAFISFKRNYTHRLKEILNR